MRSSIQLAKTRLGADRGSDHELLIAKYRLKLKKVGETTRPFNYDLSHIPYNYIRKSQIVIRSDRVPEELWTEVHDIVQEAVIGDHPQEEEMQKCKMVV